MATRSATMLPWNRAKLAPVVLLKGPQDFLAQLAWDALRAQALKEDADTEIVRVETSGYQAGQLAQYASPSLFSTTKLIHIRSLHTMNDDLLADLLRYVPSPAPDVWLVLEHSGATRGKKLLDLLKKLGTPTFECPELKNDKAKIDLLVGQARSQGREIDPAAAAALVDALGSDLREMVAMMNQLLVCVEAEGQRLSLELVHKFLQGRNEASGFDVADALVRGNVAQSLALARQALATGVAPLLIVAAAGAKFRQMAKVSGPAPRALGSVSLGMSDWMARSARQNAARWSDQDLGRALVSIAQADFNVKGGSRDGAWAVEQMILEICRAYALANR